MLSAMLVVVDFTKFSGMIFIYRIFYEWFFQYFLQDWKEIKDYKKVCICCFFMTQYPSCTLLHSIQRKVPACELQFVVVEVPMHHNATVHISVIWKIQDFCINLSNPLAPPAAITVPHIVSWYINKIYKAKEISRHLLTSGVLWNRFWMKPYFSTLNTRVICSRWWI